MKIFLRSSVLLIVLVRRVGDGDGKLSTPLRFLSLRRLFLFRSNVHNNDVIMAIWFPFWRHFLFVTGGIIFCCCVSFFEQMYLAFECIGCLNARSEGDCTALLYANTQVRVSILYGVTCNSSYPPFCMSF